MNLFNKITALYPKILAIILILISITPFGIYGASGFLPMVDIMFIYYWCIYKPHLVPNWFVFAMGLLRDAVSGSPIGLNALVNLILRFLVMYKRDDYATQPFIIVWQGFALSAVIVMTLKWIGFSLLFDQFFEIKVILLQFLLSVVMYPLFHSFFNIIFAITPKDSGHA